MEDKRTELGHGKPLPVKVLSTSLGVALAANLVFVPGAHGEAGSGNTDGPKLVEWSTEDVKQYYEPNTDWNIPLPEDLEEGGGDGQADPSSSPSSGGGSAPIVIHHGGGFGWDDLLLYHMIFNRGGSYSSAGWYDRHPVYDTRTNQPYKPRSFTQGSFENKPVTGSTVKPKTSASTGKFKTKSSTSSKSRSSSSGSIGKKSGGFSFGG